MPEILSPSAHEADKQPETSSEAKRAALGGAALLSAETVRAFYGAQAHYLGRSIDDDSIRSVIRKTGGDTEVLATGTDLHDTLSATLEGMHTLETADTKPVTRFSVDGKKVSLTELKNYSPHIAPSLESYPVPAHLEGVLKDDTTSMSTYERTTKQQNWQQELFEQIGDYLQQDEAIAQLADDLHIRSLDTLTPEQAAKLSLGTVQLLSKYSWLQQDGKRVPGGKREDAMTTMELLAEGEDHHNNPEWVGNGVCRNVASNVKAVFEALKANQKDLSMLRNTYAVVESGSEGFGALKRSDPTKTSMIGHAWNTFVTIDKEGGSSITTVDATWAMGRNRDGTLVEADRTAERMFENIAVIMNSTKDKSDAAWALSDYLNKTTRRLPGEDVEAHEQKLQFALSEWLKVVPTLLAADIPSVPAGVTGAAYRLGAQLDKGELQTLFAVREAGWIDNFDAILGKYVNGKTHLGGGDRFIVRDDNLQSALFEKLGDRTQEYAADSAFRLRLRDVKPDALPDFDPTGNPADKAELSILLRDANLYVLGNKYYGDVVRAGLLKAADGQWERVADAIGDKSDYAILRHYHELRSMIVASR